MPRRRRRIARAARRFGRRGKAASMGNIMGIVKRVMNPLFAIFALDVISRTLQNTLNQGFGGLRLPRAGSAAVSLSFNLLRLKISSHFAKGLPFGIGAFANLAVRLSALQLALEQLPIFLDPASYQLPVKSKAGKLKEEEEPLSPITYETTSFLEGPRERWDR